MVCSCGQQEGQDKQDSLGEEREKVRQTQGTGAASPLTQ